MSSVQNYYLLIFCFLMTRTKGQRFHLPESQHNSVSSWSYIFKIKQNVVVLGEGKVLLCLSLEFNYFDFF